LCTLDRQGLWLDGFVRARLLAQELETTASTRILSRFVPHEIRRDSKEPRPFAHDRLLAHGAKECLLCDLVGPIAIAEPPRQVADERLVIFAKQPIDVVHRILTTRPPASATRRD
jgi:hypothetical protein